MITFVGTGGVGKTSLSLATAIQGARQGRRVAAITVDPSRRLTSLLGLESSDQHSKSIQWEGVEQPLDIFYVDPPTLFQNFVAANMKPELYAKLKENGIYKQVSQNLRETHNFAALYKTEQVFSSDDYDLVVLDTPPCHQVVDFFESPARLQRFFSAAPETSKKGWVYWLQERGLQVAEGFLKTLVGDEFVEEMDHFFRFVGDVKTQIYKTSESFINHMQSPKASLQLVFPPALDKIQDALYLNKEISGSDFRINGLILNRAYPHALDFSEEVSLRSDGLEKSLYDYYVGQKQESETILSEFKKYAPKEIKHFVRIPEFQHTIEKFDDVLWFAEAVNTHWEVLWDS